jgi:hypothetical protein
MDAQGTTSVESGEDVKQAATELAEKHRKKRSDAGQSRGTRKAQGTASTPVQAAPIDPAVLINLELVKDATKALIGAVDGFVCRKIYTKSIRLGADKNLAVEYAQSAGLTKDESKVISECTASIMSRSDFLIRHAPEVMLVAVAASYSVRVIGTLKRLDELEERLKKAHKLKDPPVDEPSAPKP